MSEFHSRSGFVQQISQLVAINVMRIRCLSLNYQHHTFCITIIIINFLNTDCGETVTKWLEIYVMLTNKMHFLN